MFTQATIVIAAAAVAAPAVAPEVAASNWIALVDQQKWDDSWSAASPKFQGQVSKEQWAAAVQPVRQPLGAVTSRKAAKTTAASSLPGVGAGDFRVVKFQTTFANKAGATETVVLVLEGSEWKVLGYFVQ
jgi:hypothetical protein